MNEDPVLRLVLGLGAFLLAVLALWLIGEAWEKFRDR